MPTLIVGIFVDWETLLFKLIHEAWITFKFSLPWFVSYPISFMDVRTIPKACIFGWACSSALCFRWFLGGFGKPFRSYHLFECISRSCNKASSVVVPFSRDDNPIRIWSYSAPIPRKKFESIPFKKSDSELDLIKCVLKLSKYLGVLETQTILFMTTFPMSFACLRCLLDNWVSSLLTWKCDLQVYFDFCLFNSRTTR